MASFLVAPQGLVRQQAAPLTCPVAPRSLCTRLPPPTWLTPVHLPSRSTFRPTLVTAAASTEAAPAPAASVPWWQRPAPENVKHISSVQEMVDELAAARDQLVVVDFYAPWCGACRSLYPKLCKLAAENPDVIFLCVNFDESRMLVKGLNVKVLPYFHFYRGPEGRVAAFSASVSKVQLLRDAIAVHNTPRCALSDVFGLQEFPDVLPGRHVLSDAASAFAGEAAGLPSSSGEAPCDFCGPPQSGSESESDSSSGGSHGVRSGNGAEVPPPPIVAGPFDGDALMM